MRHINRYPHNITNTSASEFVNSLMTIQTPLVRLHYHGLCLDGTVAAIAFQEELDHAVRSYAANQHAIMSLPIVELCTVAYNYRKDIDLEDWVKGAAGDLYQKPERGYVVFVDFCPDRETLECFNRHGIRVLVIDHHYDRLSNVLLDATDLPRVTFWVSADPMGRSDSGCSLVLNFFGAKITYEGLVEIARRRDLHLHQGARHTPEHNLGAWWKSGSVADWLQGGKFFTKLMDTYHDQSALAPLLEEGEALSVVDDEKALEALASLQKLSTTYTTQIHGDITVGIYNIEPAYATEYCTLAPEDIVCFYTTASKTTSEKVSYKLSLRCKRDDLDMNALAADFGGGGHRGAAGAFITIHPAMEVVNHLASGMGAFFYCVTDKPLAYV